MQKRRKKQPSSIVNYGSKAAPTSCGASTVIANSIRTRIANGALLPGIRLGQLQLAEQYMTSQVPVREALNLLTSEGILRHDLNRGFFVAELSSSDAAQLFRLRAAVEDTLLQTIEMPTKTKILRLKRLAIELEKLIELRDRVNWWAKHREFYVEIFSLSPDKIIVQEALRFWSLTDRFRSILPMPERSKDAKQAGEHELLTALEEEDLAAFIRIRRKRRRKFEKRLLNLLSDNQV